MTIYLYSGTPGTGKSLHAASEIRLALNRRTPHPVIGNFPINGEIVRHPEWYSYVPNANLDTKRLCDTADLFWQRSGIGFKEDYLTLVLDECQ